MQPVSLRRRGFVIGKGQQRVHAETVFPDFGTLFFRRRKRIEQRMIGIHALLQFAGVGATAVTLELDHRAAGMTARNMSALLATFVEAAGLVNPLDLAGAVAEDFLDRIAQDVAVAEFLDSLTAHTGINRAVALQQVEALAAVVGVGAVAGGEFIEPVAA